MKSIRRWFLDRFHDMDVWAWKRKYGVPFTPERNCAKCVQCLPKVDGCPAYNLGLVEVLDETFCCQYFEAQPKMLQFVIGAVITGVVAGGVVALVRWFKGRK